MPYFGLLNINKPLGATSRDVVNRVQRLVRPAKAGHAGTLDPLATGVLVVCVGAATRLIEYVQQMPKQYKATFLLGRISPTEDVEGDVTELDAPPVPTAEQLRAAADRLTGEIEQRPPAYSALKVAGRRAYKLARAGKAVELAPRTIVIHQISIVQYEYPELTLDVQCGSGTYVRSLGRDLAESVGTGAVMSGLERTGVGAFRVEDAFVCNELTVDNFASHLIPAIQALSGMPTRAVSDNEAQLLANGRAIYDEERRGSDEIAAIDAKGQLLAILAPGPGDSLRPIRNFPQSHLPDSP